MKKKLLSIALMLCLLVTGCGSSGSTSNTSSQGTTDSESSQDSGTSDSESEQVTDSEASDTSGSSVDESSAKQYPDPISFYNCQYETSDDGKAVVFYSDYDLEDAVSEYISLASDYGFSFTNAAETLTDDFSAATGYILAYDGDEDNGCMIIHFYGFKEDTKDLNGDYHDCWLMSIELCSLDDFERVEVDAYEYDTSSGSGSTAGGSSSSEDEESQSSQSEEESEKSSFDDSEDSGTSSNTKTLLVEELSSDAAAKPASDGMDFMYYAQQEMTFGGGTTSEITMERGFKGTASDYEVIKAYVELLCEEYEFELAADPYYQEYSTYTFFEFELNYTGSKSMIGSGTKGVYTDNYGDVMIYAQIKRDTLKGSIYYDCALDMADDGYVYGSSSGGSSYIGDSFTAGLYRLADGSFQTTDGRLTASLGEAMLISDGTSTTFVSSFLYDNDDNRQEIYVKNSYGTEQQVIYIPTTVTLATGQIYDSSYFIIESDWATNDRGISSNVPSYTWTAMFACLHDGSYIYPVRALSGVMTDLNVRVMYVDESIAVFYTCAQFESSPYEIESLIAVAIGEDTVVENQPTDEYTISVGESVDISGPYEYDTGYNLWSWEFLYGEEYATLTGDNAQICRITGDTAGDVRVKVTYSYSVKEPDVLTGIERSVGHSTTCEYVIHVE